MYVCNVYIYIGDIYMLYTIVGVTIPLVGRKLWPYIKMARMLAAMQRAAQVFF